jgi:hypothetical protein
MKGNELGERDGRIDNFYSIHNRLEATRLGLPHRDAPGQEHRVCTDEGAWADAVLEIIRGPKRRGFILVAQFLFGLVVELLVLAFWLARLFPKLIGTADDVDFRLVYSFAFTLRKPAR